MYIVNNCKGKPSFKVTKKNGISSIEAEESGMRYRATETRHPVQYFCIPHVREEGSTPLRLPTKELQKSSLFILETVYDRVVEAEQETSYNMLVNAFGDKNSRKRIKKREAGPAPRTRTIQTSIGNQLLPNFDKDAEDAKDAYKLELLFNEDILMKLSHVDVNLDDLCYLVKESKSDEETHLMIVAVDCLYKILILKNIRYEHIPREYHFFYDEIRDELSRGRLSSLQRDKLIIKVYIILLMINGYSMHYDDFPTFDAPRVKVVGMLKAIGCTIKPSGLVTLTNLPQETLTA